MAYPIQGWQQPYGGYYPPMQDQLAQLRSQPYMPQQPAQQAPNLRTQAVCRRCESLTIPRGQRRDRPSLPYNQPIM